MNKDSQIEELEKLLAALMQPMKNIPFRVVIRAMSNHRLIPFDETNTQDQALLKELTRAIRICAENLERDGIESRRVNEVGNYVEIPVKDAINRETPLRAETPKTKSGKGKTAGYPDLILFDQDKRPTYLEIKTYNERNVGTTQRSFYLSPSESFKVIHDARHLLLAFQIEDTGKKRSNKSVFRPVAYKLVALDNLRCDLKHEFNSDNRRLYGEGRVLVAEEIGRSQKS